MVLLWVDAGVRLASIFYDLWEHRLAAQVERGLQLAQAEVDQFQQLSVLVGAGQMLAAVATIVAVCLWIYRAYANLSYLQVRGLQYSPGWAVGFFFIPILNLFRPCQVVQEMWRASDPEAAGPDQMAWQYRPGSALVGLWWALWIITSVLGSIIFRVSLSSQDSTPGQVKTLAMLSIVDDVLAVPAALCLILVIHKLRQRQADKHARVRARLQRDDFVDDEV
jgi:hypothetical protein